MLENKKNKGKECMIYVEVMNELKDKKVFYVE